jgi:hypothetical protein
MVWSPDIGSQSFGIDRLVEYIGIDVRKETNIATRHLRNIDVWR